MATPQKKKTTKNKAPAKSVAKTLRRPRREKKPAAQRTSNDYAVGYGKPPVEHQWQPGQSGNPNGAPKARTNLWPTLCRMSELTEKELRDMLKPGRRKELKLVEIVAIKNLLQLREGVTRKGIPLLLKTIIERDEGKPAQTLHIDSPDTLSPEECEEIRRVQREMMEGRRQDKP